MTTTDDDYVDELERIEAESPESPRAYWLRARRPFSCMVFLAPLLVAHVVVSLWLGTVAPEVRDATAEGGVPGMHRMIPPAFAWAVPASIGFVLLLWNAYGQVPWRCRADTLGGMASESVLFAWVVVGLAAAFGVTSSAASAADGDAGVSPAIATLVHGVDAVGAGLYEETLFRLLLLPLVFTVVRACGARERWALAIAFLASGLAFAVGYHVGPAGETVAPLGFAFRAVAGCVFATVFWFRGYGIAAGSHAAYELIAAFVLAE